MLNIMPMLDTYQDVAVTVESREEAEELCRFIMDNYPECCRHWDNDHEYWSKTSKAAYTLNFSKVRYRDEYILQHSNEEWFRSGGTLLIPLSALRESAEMDEISDADFIGIYA